LPNSRPSRPMAMKALTAATTTTTQVSAITGHAPEVPMASCTMIKTPVSVSLRIGSDDHR
jgi:hypothetical protein